MAGPLLYTAAPDSEGTLGGLVDLAARIASSSSSSPPSSRPGCAARTRSGLSTSRAATALCTAPPATPARSPPRPHASAVTGTGTAPCLWTRSAVVISPTSGRDDRWRIAWAINLRGSNTPKAIRWLARSQCAVAYRRASCNSSARCQQFGDGSSLLDCHRWMHAAERAEELRADGKVWVVGGPQQPPILVPRREALDPHSEATHLVGILATSRSFRRGHQQVLVNPVERGQRQQRRRQGAKAMRHRCLHRTQASLAGLHCKQPGQVYVTRKSPRSSSPRSGASDPVRFSASNQLSSGSSTSLTKSRMTCSAVVVSVADAPAAKLGHLGRGQRTLERNELIALIFTHANDLQR